MDNLEALLDEIVTELQNYNGERIGRTRVGDYTVSTLDSIIAGWSTAIWKGSGDLVIVAYYATKEEALQGHQDWVDACKLNPTVAWSVRLNKYITL